MILQYDSRDVLKADAMIIGTAKAAGATIFYTHDARCRALAQLVMKVEDLPTFQSGKLFLKNQNEQGEIE